MATEDQDLTSPNGPADDLKQAAFALRDVAREWSFQTEADRRQAAALPPDKHMPVPEMPQAATLPQPYKLLPEMPASAALPQPYKLLPETPQAAQRYDPLWESRQESLDRTVREQRKAKQEHAYRQDLLDEAMAQRAPEQATSPQAAAKAPAALRPVDANLKDSTSSIASMISGAVGNIPGVGLAAQVGDAGKLFYRYARMAGDSLQEALGSVSGFFRAYGVDKASPNTMATLEKSVDLLLMRVGRAFVPLAEAAAGTIQRVANSRNVQAASIGLETAFTVLVNSPTAKAVLGEPTPEKRSEVGLPKGEMFGGPEQYYDALLAKSLAMMPGTLEAQERQEQLKTLSEILGEMKTFNARRGEEPPWRP